MICVILDIVNLKPNLRNILTIQCKIRTVEGGFQILFIVLQNKNCR